MAKYRLTFKKSVAKDLRRIPKHDVKRVLSRIEALADNPRGKGCVKLSAQERYRARQGVYRIVYEIQDDRVDGRNMDGEDFALTAGRGYYGTGEAVMPGQGRVVERDYTPDERAALVGATGPVAPTG